MTGELRRVNYDLVSPGVNQLLHTFSDTHTLSQGYSLLDQIIEMRHVFLPPVVQHNSACCADVGGNVKISELNSFASVLSVINKFVQITIHPEERGVQRKFVYFEKFTVGFILRFIVFRKMNGIKQFHSVSLTTE